MEHVPTACDLRLVGYSSAVYSHRMLLANPAHSLPQKYTANTGVLLSFGMKAMIMQNRPRPASEVNTQCRLPILWWHQFGLAVHDVPSTCRPRGKGGKK